MGYRLVMTDIDGTMLNEKGQATERVRATLAELERRGIPVVLVTARPPRRVFDLYRELGLKGPVVAYNGAIAFEPDNGRVLFAHTMPKPLALKVVAAMRAAAPEANLGLELEDEWRVDRHEPRFQELWERGLITDFPLFGQLEEVLATTDRQVNKCYLFASPEQRAALEANLEAAGVRGEVYVTSSSTNLVEILPGGVNKGSALRALAAILGVPREQTLYLGDEEADMPALQEAGLGIAMGNAPDRVKAVAGALTLSNAEEGWAEAIAAHVLAG